MIKKLIAVAIILVIVIGVFYFSQGDKKHFFSTQNYRIGVMTNFEGENAEGSIADFNALELAYEDYQERNPKGLRYDIIPLDSSWDPQKARSSFEKIRRESDVIFLISTSTSFLSFYRQVVMKPRKLCFLKGVTTTEISGIDDNVIRIGMDSKLEQKLIADYFHRNNVSRLVVLHVFDHNHRYIDQALGYFEKFYNGDIVKVPFSASNYDASAVLEVLERDPDLQYVYFLSGGISRQAGLFAQELHRKFPDVKVLNTPWNRGKIFFEAMGKYGKNVILSSQINTSDANMLFKKFRDAFSRRFGYEPITDSAMTYDLASVMFDSINKLDTCDIDELKKYIATMDSNGASGKIKFTPSLDSEGKLFFYLVTGQGDNEILEK